MSGEQRPRLATGYGIRKIVSGGHVVTIDGEDVPWHMSAAGPRVEATESGITVLWLPVLVDAPILTEVTTPPTTPEQSEEQDR